MTLIELYNLTILHEALKQGQKIRTSDINFVYKTIPDAPKLKSKQGKINVIKQCFDKLSEATLKKYLVDNQKDIPRTSVEQEFIDKCLKEDKLAKNNEKIIRDMIKKTIE